MANFECSKINFNELMTEAKKAIVDFLYPPKVGIVISYDATFDPNTNWGVGKWKLLPGGYALVSTDSRTNDSGIALTAIFDGGGSSSDVASTHKVRSRNAGGIPDIEGDIGDRGMPYEGDFYGAFKESKYSKMGVEGGSSWHCAHINFKASNSNKAYGRYSSSSTVVPDHISVNIWYRYE